METSRTKHIYNQVGYHNKFIGTFMEAKKIIDSGSLGKLQLFSGNMNGPVVTKTREHTWRSKPEEGGGCLMDYAAHLIDLINYLIAPITVVHGADLMSFYSASVEDAVSCLLETKNGIHGTINVNWSDETFRKMSTSITILGSKGKLTVDSTELKVYFREEQAKGNYTKGWNVRHINALSPHVDFYLRGEEYSLQIDHFINVLEGKALNNINTFESALQTDKVIQQIKNHKIN
jgi:predicted dehydrogenase